MDVLIVCAILKMEHFPDTLYDFTQRAPEGEVQKIQ